MSRSEDRLHELVRELNRYQLELDKNEFKTDWDKKYAELRVKGAQEGIVAVVRMIYK